MLASGGYEVFACVIVYNINVYTHRLALPLVSTLLIMDQPRNQKRIQM